MSASPPAQTVPAPTPLDDALANRISPQVAVARLLLQGHTPASILHLTQANHPTTSAIRHLVESRTPALDTLAAEIAATAARHDASGPGGIARIAAFFDHAVRHSPEASVALFSLGDAEILAAATTEIVTWLQAQHLLPPRADILDLGCGIGRIAAALAPNCRTILGLDVSPAMVGEATTRLAATPNVTIRHTEGHDLDTLPQAAFDLILAVDSFPYIVQSGTALRHVQSAARALRPGGALCILNLSYRGDDSLDLQDATTWAAASGLHLHPGGRPFALWDGSAFVLRR